MKGNPVNHTSIAIRPVEVEPTVATATPERKTLWQALAAALFTWNSTRTRDTATTKGFVTYSLEEYNEEGANWLVTLESTEVVVYGPGGDFLAIWPTYAIDPATIAGALANLGLPEVERS